MMKIGICTFVDENIKEFSFISTFVHQLYANRHQYDYQVFSKKYFSNRTAHWEKLNCLLEMLNQSYDYVMWIDADAIFYNFDFKLEEWLQMYPTEMYFSSDYPYSSSSKNYINTGIMIMKNTDWVKNFIHEWINHKLGIDFYQNAYHEQQTVNLLYDCNICDIKTHCLIFGSYLFNIYLFEDENKQIDHDHPKFLNLFYSQKVRPEIVVTHPPPSSPFILHLMKLNHTFRKEYMTRRLKEILNKFF